MTCSKCLPVLWKNQRTIVLFDSGVIWSVQAHWVLHIDQFISWPPLSAPAPRPSILVQCTMIAHFNVALIFCSAFNYYFVFESWTVDCSYRRITTPTDRFAFAVSFVYWTILVLSIVVGGVLSFMAWVAQSFISMAKEVRYTAVFISIV